jgi:hypothetical protein
MTLTSRAIGTPVKRYANRIGRLTCPTLYPVLWASYLGFGRIAASEKAPPNMLENPV